MKPDEYRRMFDVEEIHWWYVGLHQLVLSLVGREARSRGRRLEIFDAGCGTGRLAQLMSGIGHVEGCDSSDIAIGFCRARGLDGIGLADLNVADLPRGRYDVITAMDLLYHANIRDDSAVLEKFRDALRPGGLLLLHLPAWPCLFSTHDLAVETRERYRRKPLLRKLKGAGFDVEFISYRVFFLFPLMALYRLLKRILHRFARVRETRSDVALPPRPVNACLLGLIRLENRLLGRCALPCGTSLLAVARAPGCAA